MQDEDAGKSEAVELPETAELSDDEKAALLLRYQAALHSIQSAIAYDISRSNVRDGATRNVLKHHRVGIDEGKSTAGGLATLLIEKGVFTQDEYLVATVDAAEREVGVQTEYVCKKHNVDPNKVSFK